MGVSATSLPTSDCCQEMPFYPELSRSHTRSSLYRGWGEHLISLAPCGYRFSTFWSCIFWLLLTCWLSFSFLVLISAFFCGGGMWILCCEPPKALFMLSNYPSINLHPNLNFYFYLCLFLLFLVFFCSFLSHGYFKDAFPQTMTLYPRSWHILVVAFLYGKLYHSCFFFKPQCSLRVFKRI